MHRVGRVARAGRSGTAYSFVATDELPFMIDLQLFLGRRLILAGSPEMPEPTDMIFGSTPQRLIDENKESCAKLVQSNILLEGLTKVVQNAMKLYLRTRPSPAPESFRRAKQIDLRSLKPHSMWNEFVTHVEEERISMLEQIRKFRAKQRKQPAAKKAVAINAVVSHRDEQFYIPQQPKDGHTEKGYSMLTGATGDGFLSQARQSAFEIGGDDSEQLAAQARTNTKWDRKRKKFVKVAKDDEGGRTGKKLRTESGVVLKKSYKTNAFEKWKEQNKVNLPRSGEQENARLLPVRPLKQRSRVVHPSPEERQQKKQAHRELKSKEQILKQRKQTAKVKQRQKGRK